MSKPIRVFWSPLSHRFYASRAYREDKNGKFVTITGEQFDVTQDIAHAIMTHEISFSKRDEVDGELEDNGGLGDATK